MLPSRLLLLLVAAMTVSGLPVSAFAEDVLSPEQILEQLQNSISVDPSDIPAERRNEGVRTKSLPDLADRGIDLTVQFEYNSDQLTPQSAMLLVNLGKALGTPALAGKDVLIAGHTDAKGSDTYNLSLSQRRADAVRSFLVGNMNLDASHLVAIGFGERQLKNNDDPEGAENRRVQVAFIK